MSIIDEAGDRSRFVDNERLDIEDVSVGQLLTEALTMRQAGRWGHCAGVLGAPPAFTWIPATQRLSVGACTLFYSSYDATRNEELAAAVRYDPSAAWQVTQAPMLGAYAAGSTPCVLWAKRDPVASDTATRKVWTGGAEVNTAVETVWREYVTMTAAAVGVELAFPWFPFAKVTGWVAGVPTVIAIPVADGDYEGVNFGNAAVITAFPAVDTANVYLGTTLAKGTTRQMKLQRASLARLNKADGSVAWWNTSGITRGVQDLDMDLSQLEVFTLPVAAADVFWDGINYTLFAARWVDAFTVRTGVGTVNIQFEVPVTWSIINIITSTRQVAIKVGQSGVTNIGPTTWEVTFDIHDITAAMALIDADFQFEVIARKL